MWQAEDRSGRVSKDRISSSGAARSRQRRERRGARRIGDLGDVVEVLDERAEGVSVGGDDELLAGLDDGHQRVVPERHKALHLRHAAPHVSAAPARERENKRDGETAWARQSRGKAAEGQLRSGSEQGLLW